MGQQLSQPGPSPRGRDGGFSLIELLVVIAVLSVLSVGAVLSTGRGGTQREDATDMARFEDSFTRMRAMAIQGRELRGLRVQGTGPVAVRPRADGWVVTQTAPPWHASVAFAKTGELPEPGGPDIRFLPNGRTSAFTIGFAGGGRCASDGWAGLNCEEG